MADTPESRGTNPPPAAWGGEGTPRTSGSGSKFDLAYGRRPMKAYPITEGELGQLTAIGGGALFCFSLGAGLFGFSLDVSKDLAMAPNLPIEAVSAWEIISIYAKNSSWASFGIGSFLLLWRHNVLSRIKNETTFPEDANGTR